MHAPYSSQWAPRRVDLRGVSGEWQVEPPSARAAITILEARGAYEAAFSEELSDAVALGLTQAEALLEAVPRALKAVDFPLVRRVAFEWLPMRLASSLFAKSGEEKRRPREHGEQLHALAKLVSSFTPRPEEEPDQEEEEPEDAPQEEEDDPSPPDWQALTMRLAFGLKMSPEAVLSMSWPSYLSSASYLPQAQAQEQLRSAAWYAGAKTGEMDAIIEKAYPDAPSDKPERVATPEWEKEGLSKEEYREQKMAEARALKKQWTNDDS